MEEIRKIREAWLQAYLDGNTVTLEQIESENFSIVSGQGVESNPARLKNIATRKLNGKWFGPFTSFQNSQMEYQQLGPVTTVTGFCQIIGKDRIIRSSYTSEVWQKINGKWRIILAHASAKNEI
ncbi:nuclear transport factor 2 family protein [Pseudoalteromonas galatheae]|uniref:nuclear transport factor 2 family protein n=1 Tax=Pseudoalteromonas galatheae TaxID=579562 RepID=UPI0030CFFA62